jgi:hypothetical protein
MERKKFDKQTKPSLESQFPVVNSKKLSFKSKNLSPLETIIFVEFFEPCGLTKNKDLIPSCVDSVYTSTMSNSPSIVIKNRYWKKIGCRVKFTQIIEEKKK